MQHLGAHLDVELGIEQGVLLAAASTELVLVILGHDLHQPLGADMAYCARVEAGFDRHDGDDQQRVESTAAAGLFGRRKRWLEAIRRDPVVARHPVAHAGHFDAQVTLVGGRCELRRGVPGCHGLLDRLANRRHQARRGRCVGKRGGLRRYRGEHGLGLARIDSDRRQREQAGSQHRTIGKVQKSATRLIGAPMSVINLFHVFLLARPGAIGQRALPGAVAPSRSFRRVAGLESIAATSGQSTLRCLGP